MQINTLITIDTQSSYIAIHTRSSTSIPAFLWTNDVNLVEIMERDFDQTWASIKAKSLLLQRQDIATHLEAQGAIITRDILPHQW